MDGIAARTWEKPAGLGAPGLAADRGDLDDEDARFLADVIGALERDPFLPTDRLARRLHISPSRLAHRFRMVAGISPGAFAGALRMQEAKRLLVDTGLPVLDVALEVGYASLGTFTTRFTSLVGTASGRYRARLGEGPTPVLDPERAVRDCAVHGALRAPAGFTGLAFVGLFPSNVPAGLPVRGTLARVPGPYRLERCPPGSYHVLAAAYGPQPGLRDLLLSRAEAVGAGRQAVWVGIQGTSVCDLDLRPPTLGDPPVVVSLALLSALPPRQP